MKKKTKKILKRFSFFPKKSLGQHFLSNKKILRRIVSFINPKEKEVVVEIGAGLGFLTEFLAQKAKRIIAIEKDDSLVKILKKKFQNYPNVKILKMDVLNFVPEKHLSKTKYIVVGNLPYNISLPIIWLFLETEHQPREMIFLIQKEVAQRICSKKSSLLKIALEFYARPRILFSVSKKYFFPQPKVDGALIKIEKISKGKKGIDKKKFFEVIKIGFAHPRKTILNNLSFGLKLKKEKIKKLLKKSKINPSWRSEKLTINHWIVLCKNLSKI